MFEKLVSFTKKVADLADRPSLNSAELKNQFDAAPDEVRVYLNKLIDALKSTTAGDSGAKNTGASVITGLEGTDVQALLESLYNKITVLDPWANVATQNGWSHHGTIPCQYSKDPSGIVRLRGILTPGILTSGVTPFVLPANFRPKKDYDVITKVVAPGGALNFTTLVVTTTGNVSIYDNLNIAALYVNNISFRTDS
jgi:hypothetical protein